MSFTLLQWNCLYSEDINKIASFIRKINPDVICLQELTQDYHATAEDAGEWIAQELGYFHYCTYGPMHFPDGTQLLMGNGILSRLPFATTASLTLQGSKLDGSRIIRDGRFYLQASILLDDQEVYIGTTHLPFHPQFQTTHAKQGMIERILHQIPQSDHFVLAGDFNATPRTKAAMTFRRRGLKNAGPSLSLPTWTTKPFALGTWTYNELQFRLDYVLHKPGIHPVRAEILQTELSDHLPILVEFELRQNK